VWAIAGNYCLVGDLAKPLLAFKSVYPTKMRTELTARHGFPSLVGPSLQLSAFK